MGYPIPTVPWDGIGIGPGGLGQPFYLVLPRPTEVAYLCYPEYDAEKGISRSRNMHKSLQSDLTAL